MDTRYLKQRSDGLWLVQVPRAARPPTLILRLLVQAWTPSSLTSPRPAREALTLASGRRAVIVSRRLPERWYVPLFSATVSGPAKAAFTNALAHDELHWPPGHLHCGSAHEDHANDQREGHGFFAPG